MNSSTNGVGAASLSVTAYHLRNTPSLVMRIALMPLDARALAIDHFGRTRRAHARLHHLDDALGQLQIGDVRRLEPGRSQHVLHDEAVLDRAGEQVERFGGDLFGRHERAGRPAVRRRHDGDMFIVEQLAIAEPPVVGLVVHDCQIELRVEQGRDRVHRVLGDDLQPERG